VAETLREQLGLETTLEPGDRGEFTVWVGPRIVARKTLDGFPTPEGCLEAVRAAL
jgi:hypothetical protein